MDPFDDLKRRYKDLRSQYDDGKLSPDHFLAEVQQLRTQDASGTWWAVNSKDGSFLRYDGSDWIPAKPLKAPKVAAGPKKPFKLPAPKVAAGPKKPFKLPQLPSNLRPLLPFAGLILSTSCGVLWTLYTFIRVGQGEQADCMTPFILGGLPIALWIFRKPIGVLLRPLEPIRRTIPRPVLLGAAFAVPVVLGVLFSSLTSYGYGAMRLSAIISILAAYVLSRKPERVGTEVGR
jgi:hypothetical protein